MSGPGSVKQQVQQFYDQVGWQQVAEGVYQNMRYEDLRPVSEEYRHRCHLRVGRYLAPQGRFLLDAGSGPVQYPEYLTYSHGYTYRVCADLSLVALKEARARLGSHGLYVVADVANLPFRSEVFEGAVSLHTFHHLPLEEQEQAYHELYRVLKPGATGVVVNGWTDSPIMRRFEPLLRLMERIKARWGRSPAPSHAQNNMKAAVPSPSGTFVEKMTPAWLKARIGAHIPLEIRVWRSVSVRFLRAMIHEGLLGRVWLRLIFALEERFPHYFGENGQYPMIILRKPQ
ncbi:class I SAM-dependent methyltransferase [Thermanaerothrix sp. 4228-RoL]|uniref:Class I SAM-dependent methyltransferase n=1 Tax=Thermanaerothrix solaris TaxID=3058434 RepID=A0ABU3NQG6_9CHLR|nr:class I SAM-dependent methyltransferase [Thermanaerothrix sp. 4228-RoL]MDT8899078.1 class I SAM-dependent methyltransferase [Thermanaerothrix sp. 4228-RoL]